MIESRNTCKYNSEVFCMPHERHCNKCGWCPEVAERRIQDFLKDYLKKIESAAQDAELAPAAN